MSEALTAITAFLQLDTHIAVWPVLRGQCTQNLSHGLAALMQDLKRRFIVCLCQRHQTGYLCVSCLVQIVISARKFGHHGSRNPQHSVIRLLHRQIYSISPQHAGPPNADKAGKFQEQQQQLHHPGTLHGMRTYSRIDRMICQLVMDVLFNPHCACMLDRVVRSPGSS